MSKEAMKLALEALEYIYEGANKQGPHTGISWRCVSNKAEPAITALREALAEPQEKYIYGTPLLDAMTGKANEALDKKAQNARELGLDYEPVWDNLPSNKDVEDAMRLKRLNQLTSPPAQRKPLTDEAIWLEYQLLWPFHPAEEPTLAKDIAKFARAIEAAHGIKENT